MKSYFQFSSVVITLFLLSMTPANVKPVLRKKGTILQSGNNLMWPGLSSVNGLERQFTPSFVNDICLPSKLYMLSGVQNDIFVEHLIKRWRPYNDVVRFSGTAKFQRRLQRVASINKPEDGTTVTISLINEDKFDTIKSITSEIVTGKPGAGDDSVFVSIIGDSFTNGAFFKDALITKEYVPKIQLVGLRNALGCPGQYDEGRGGWTLADYFTVSTDRANSYNGFWQPVGSYNYWGATAFWKLANEVRINPKGNWTFNESYFTGRFETQSLLFDANTGYKLSPQASDLMFDNAKGHYVKYNGSKWIRAAYNDFSWSFSYEKYLAMWKLPKPSILIEFLGSNDFGKVNGDPSLIDFRKWNSQIREMAASYLKAVPGGKFVMLISGSASGTLDNTSGDFNTRDNAIMWELRRNIIENFDKKESENIYIVDTGISIDSEYGFNLSSDAKYTRPYSEYPGKESITVQTGNGHPYPNYPNMGVSLAAFIQKYR